MQREHQHGHAEPGPGGKGSDITKEDERVQALVKPKIRLRELCQAVQGYVESTGFRVVKQFVGHGIGRDLHEPPQIPNFVTPTFDMNLVLRSGMALAFEPMVNAGTEVVVNRGGDWPVVTRDGKLSVHFENTVLVTGEGSEVLTTVAGEE